ncbi:MAG: amino acid ABC transporter permease [Actinobacteria bacterium HGW-Actinobacteria-2]|nr:MAG: amino acid ABC transporter permease [Actinobacteria bacterium HGW-Actinobacteria-2]
MEGMWAIILAIPYTLLVTAGAFLVGFLLAIPLALARRSKVAPVRGVAGLLIDLARGIPPIVWLLFIFFGLPLLKIKMNALEAGILGLGVVSAGYLAEIFRGGLLAVPRGQFEACQALGLGGWTSFVEVISPQALRAMLPGLATYFIGLIKDSSIASVIGVTEMVYTATTYARNSADGIYTFFAAAAVYIVLSVPFGLMARGMEARMQVSSR